MSFVGTVVFLIDKYWPLFLQGAGNTLLIALTGTIIGFIIGLIIAVIRTIPIERHDNIIKKIFISFLYWILTIYIEIFRGTPMIIQAMVIYYGSLQVLNIDMSPIFAGIFIISINTGSYMAEIIRGGIISIDRGQFEGAQSIGMTHSQTMFSVVLPQAIRNIMPSIGNEFVINIKDSAVLSVISVTELFFMNKTVAGTHYMYFESALIASVIYLIMTYTVTRILLRIEKKMDGSDTYTIHGSQSASNTAIRVTREQVK